MKKICLFLLSFVFVSNCFGVPSNTMSISPSATSGAVISASDENSRNNEISTKFNAHTHTDITTIGAGAAHQTKRGTATGTNPTTTSTTFVDLDATNASLTITTGANPVLIGFSGSAQNNTANAYVDFDIAIDGTRQGGTSGLLRTGGEAATASVPHNASFSYLSAPLSAASHTFKIQWLVSGGTGTFLQNTASLFFWVVEEKGSN